MPLKEKHWNWIKIAIYIVAGIFVLGILKVILQIFNGTGPIPTGVGKVLGAGANLVNGIVNGCSKQPDCSKGSNTDKNSCENLTNCSFEKTKGTDGKTTGACISSNGVAPGGGINTMGCALGIGLLTWLAASILAPIAGFFINMWGKKNKTVEDISTVTGKSFDKENTDLIRKGIESGVEASKDYREKWKEEAPDHLQKMMSEITASTVTYNKLTESLRNKSDPAMEKEAADAHTKAVTDAKAAAKVVDDEASKNDKADTDANEKRESAADLAAKAAKSAEK